MGNRNIKPMGMDELFDRLSAIIQMEVRDVLGMGPFPRSTASRMWQDLQDEIKRRCLAIRIDG